MEVSDFKHMDINEIISAGNLPLICIYKNPSDFPDKYVARLWGMGRKGGVATRYIIVRDTLAQIREAMPDWMTQMGRNPIDDPVIVETWL
jgi:hypothetical protein